MLEFYAAKFLSAYAHIAILCGFSQHAINDSAGFGIGEGRWHLNVRHATDLRASLADLELPVSQAGAERIIESLNSGNVSQGTSEKIHLFSKLQAELLKSAIEETCLRISTELGSRFLLSMSADKAAYFNGSKTAFGAEVVSKFASLTYEIEEAGKCYGLDRSTASAFHSIRCLEAGIRAIARCLQIPDPTKGSQRSWANILRTVKDRMDARWPTQADRFSGDGRLFEDLCAGLNAMQNPWRNATMHLDQKYAEDEAKYLMDAIGGFMKRIASRMDEDGQPFA